MSQIWKRLRYPVKEPKELTPKERWSAKQALAQPGRYYGDGGTIHGTNLLHVETFQGKVVSVWFRCQMLPFKQVDVRPERGEAMAKHTDLPLLTGVEVID